MRKNLEWVEIQPGLVCIEDKARLKEMANCYIDNLTKELVNYCPVRNQIATYQAQKYRFYPNPKGAKGQGFTMRVPGEFHEYPVNYYRRFRKEYQRYGVPGITRMLKNIWKRFHIDNLSESERQGLDPEKLKDYQILDNYFQGLIYCVENNILPKREHHESRRQVA